MEHKEEVQEYIDICENILQDFDNEWCWPTLRGILDYIQERDRITENQITAVNRIANKIEEDAE